MNKKIAFNMVVLLSVIETTFHINQIIHGNQPSRKILFPYYLVISPAALVYDRGVGFFSRLEVTYYFKNQSFPLSFTYKENKADGRNYLEQILNRRIQLSFRNKKDLDILVKSILCKNKIKSISNMYDKDLLISKVHLQLQINFKNNNFQDTSWESYCQN